MSTTSGLWVAPARRPPGIVGAAAAAWSAIPDVVTDEGTEVYVVAGTGYCIDDWAGGPAGSYTFNVLNDEGEDMEVYLQDPESKRIYLEVENFGIGAARRVTGIIPPGTYRWVCITGYTIKGSASFTVAAAAERGAPVTPVIGVAPVTPLDLRIPINEYTAWVQGRIPELSDHVSALAADLHAGDIDTAKRDWAAAHGTYETLGAAYGAFGSLGTAINGDPARGVPAETDPDLTGFRKIEALLWSGRPAAEAAPFADGLLEDIARLTDELALPNAITPLDIGRRPHEILEDALAKDLNGVGDAGSGTELATVDANITGTMAVISPLLPLLAEQNPWLRETEDWLRETQALVRSYHRADGWAPLAALKSAERAVLNARIQQATELLSHIPPILEPRNSPDEGVGIVNDVMPWGGTGWRTPSV